jgi:hypothetical protein
MGGIPWINPGVFNLAPIFNGWNIIIGSSRVGGIKLVIAGMGTVWWIRKIYAVHFVHPCSDPNHLFMGGRCPFTPGDMAANNHGFGRFNSIINKKLARINS